MESADLGQHTSRRFNEDMERVTTRVMQMGGFVEQQLQRAVTALIEGNSSLGEEVARDDYKVNQMEVEIDEECNRIIATRQPTASDLRVMVAIIKTITDLERIGDEVEKVGNIAARLAMMEKPSDNYREIRHLGRLVTEMVHDALHAFARLDADEAFEIARRDRKVDEEYESIQRQNITFMMEDPRSIRRALEIMWVVRALERIGDHAKNICEYTVYMVHGKDIRHLSLDDAERQIRDLRARAHREPDAVAARGQRGRIRSPARRPSPTRSMRSSGSTSCPATCASSSASRWRRSASPSWSRPPSRGPAGAARCARH